MSKSIRALIGGIFAVLVMPAWGIPISTFEGAVIYLLGAILGAVLAPEKDK